MRGVWLLLFSITAVIGNGIFAFTDLAWRLSRSPTESYPEILYAAYFFPTSVLLLIDSVLLLWAKKPSPQNELWLAADAKLAGLGLLSLLFVLPFNGKWSFVQSVGQVVIDCYVFVAYPLYLYLTARGIRQIWRFQVSN
ncbi:hypothetical protein [Asticcacaulis sp.]|uniref:hypothetical protein n=1 Tax=Asticcacaulis sp. TaxID=1872648 RepID=UPI0026132356|nr:hypothetical protein [Asticcacaulis sp.]